MALVAVFLIILFAALILKTYWWQIRAKWYGKEADAVVSRIEEDIRTDAEAATHTRHFYFVRFTKENGLENEAKLLNPDPRLVTGSRVRVRYLPEKDNEAVLAEILQI